MLRNYLKVAFRNLVKNKAFSTINILGLAMGITCSLLILLWVQHEKRIDAWHEKSNRIYAVYERQYHDGEIDAGYFTPGVMAEEMKKVIPEVEGSTSFAWEELSTFQAGDKIMKQSGNHASPDFFKIFSYRLIRGTPETALNSPLSIAISRKMAVAFFGSAEAAYGKTIRYENTEDMKVTAVFENPDGFNSTSFDFLTSWDNFLKYNGWAKEWGNNGPRTYLLLKPGTDPVRLEAKIKKFLDGYNKEQTANFYIELGLQRFADIYLHSNFKNGKIAGGRIEYIRLFSIVACFILLIACINFMNLTTARSVKRSREIGIRKVSGAVRPVLIRQFIGEALLITAISVALSLVMLYLLLPLFNTITGKQITLPFGEPLFWLSLLVLTLLTGLVSGSYPALFLSSFQPIRVLKGSLKFSASATWFRKGLVIFQFVLSIILIIGTLVISKQVNYVQQVNLGFDRENLVYLPLEGELKNKYALFKQELSRLPGVKDVTRITQTPTDISNGTGGVAWEGKDPNSAPQFVQAAVGLDFVRTMNLQLVSGRDFSKDYASDSTAYLVNEAAVKVFNMKEPVGKPLTFWEVKGTIIGVLKDFHFSSLHEPIRPIVIRLGENYNWGSALIRTKPGETKQALASLEKVCKNLNPKFPFTYQFADEEYQKLYQNEQVVGTLANCFSGLAILISCLGLLGLAMFTAEQRTREFGIRKVLGASVQSLFSLLSRDFLALVLIAFVIASPLAWWAMNHWLNDYAYKIKISVWTFALGGLAAMGIALLTVSYQAIRAAIANPVKALRME